MIYCGDKLWHALKTRGDEGAGKTPSSEEILSLGRERNDGVELGNLESGRTVLGVHGEVLAMQLHSGGTKPSGVGLGRRIWGM